MPILSILIFLLFLRSSLIASQQPQFQEDPPNPHLFSAQEPWRKSARRLSKPLVRDDGRVYSCSERNLFAFESNGSIAWTVNLNYTCNVGIAPIHGGSRKIYLVAENRVLRINPLNIGTSEPAVEVFFGPKPGEEGGEIIGIAVSTLSSSVFINVKNRGLFAYRLQGQLLWSTGPMLYQWGYRQGCRKDVKDCYFSSIPVIDQCEASLYISNTEGELYSLSVQSPRFKWVQDLSSFDKSFTITPGNNGRLYVTVAVKAILLALDVNTGTVLWQRNFGPLSTTDCAPVIDSNGWLSIGSLNGFLYSFSPTGILKKFPKADAEDSVLQFSPLLDCSGYAIYISQTVMDGKISRTIGDYSYISALKPVKVVFTLLVPATGSVYWSESYPASGQFSSLWKSDLQYFVLDERILLAFITASKIGNPLQCRSTRQKLTSSCSQAEPKLVGIYTGNERAIPLFLLFETAVLIVHVIVVRFCCLFWRKKKLQGQDLGKFLEKRRSLQQQKKAFDRTITELEKKAAEEAMANEMLEKLGDLVKQKEGIERKLSTTYSLGRDRTNSKSKSLLPLSDGKTKSYSFQGSKKESVTIFHALSDTSSADSSSEKETESSFFEDKESAVKAKGKGKAHSDVGSSSDDDENCEGNEGGASAGRKGFMNPLFVGNAFDGSKELKVVDEGVVRESMQSGDRSIIRRRSLSSTY
ncbi:protein GAMETE EXPRESSED 3 isoform X1 [Rhododendron vialii]|uniref:protein GAMETE EXPRESSED 3 isoform X1 n=1 Tax=Rhododendron vialii TaxID=182163 RepID=UPI00265E5E33|nr:protein GAMETE EXPRESSED 3 isoform X1 [Rhododendron vialii]